ncbi:MAG: phosphatidylserine decarboxylase [Fluviibacter sp.]
MNYPHPLLAKEGWPFIGLAVGAAVLAYILDSGLAWLLWPIAIFVVQFFRDPPRVVAGGPNSVVSSADGRVIVVAETDDPWLNRRALKVSVFMNVFNVHSNRIPTACEVVGKWYVAGSFLNAALDKASEHNERCALHLRTPGGQDITCVQIAGLVARRILNYAEIGNQYKAGERYGFIRFGSRVDFYLPLNAQVKVSIGDKVYASSTVIAELDQAA